MCVCLSFVSCTRAICMLLVCMKCVNCSILFLISSMLSCSMFILCVLVFVLLLGERCRGLFGGGGGGGWAVVGVCCLRVGCV